MASYYPIIHPYTMDDTTDFAVSTATSVEGSMMLVFDDAPINLGVLVGERPCPDEDCEGTHVRVDLVVYDAEGDQTVIRLNLDNANLIAAALAKTMADYDITGAVDAMDIINDRGVVSDMRSDDDGAGS